MTNWNIEPYNDDFNEDNKFLKVLFRPGKAVQTRELNQLQTILQNQLSRHADNIFKQGAMVIPGQISMDNTVHYVKLMDTNIYGTSINSIIDNLVGLNLVNQNGVVAKVIFATKRTSTEQATLFVKYVSSGGTDTKSFSASDSLDVQAATTPQLDLTVSVYDGTEAVGIGSIASIERGVYYVNGMFCLVESQTITLDKYSNTPSYRVGLNVVESIVTPEDDESLLDNSQGTPNFAAPGAHRYKIDLTLSKRSLSSPDDKNFIELMRVDTGVIQKQIRSTDYSILEQTLARRTYDESGDYTVRDFSIDVREDRNNDRGTWSNNTFYRFGDIVTHNGNTYECRTVNSNITDGTSSGGNISGSNAPVHTNGTISDGNVLWRYHSTPSYNLGVNLNGDENKLCIGLGPAKAYVRGFEIEKIATEYVKVDKARKTSTISNAVISANVGNYITVYNISGGVPDISSFAILNLNDGVANIGTCRIRGIERNSDVSHKLFIFDVKMNAGKYIEQTKRVTSAGGFSCSIFGNTLKLYEPQNSSLVYPLPYYAVKSVTAEETIYVVSKVLRITSLVNVGNTYSGNYSISDGEFASEEGYTNYTVFSSSGSIIYPNISRTNNNRTLIISNLQSSATPVTVVATVIKNGAQRNKILTNSVVNVTSQSALTPPASTPLIIPLGKADAFRINSVKMDSNGFNNPNPPSYTIDITDRFVLDNGQKDTHYGIASLVLKGSYLPPNGAIQIDFDYFEHSTGDYFTINSYINIDYKEIPSFGTLSLRDSIDFRPTVASDGTYSSTSNLIPKRGYDVTLDFSYYLPRKSKICLDYTGKFFISDGESSLNPADPSDIPLSMVLYTLALEAYTFGTSDTNVKIDKVDNKRYTMRDIGKLEKRIDNLEYYTSLSLLEQETNTMSVIDTDGLDRFKNGFVVDSFTGHGVGDVTNQDYMCSIDMEKGELRPFFSMNNINMIENATTSTERVYGDNYYAAYGDVITLPIVDHTAMIEQPYGSRVENVNPFNVASFLGDMKLNPSSDDWFEIYRRPNIVNNVEGNYNTVNTLAEESGVLGTIWNSWQLAWTGIPVQKWASKISSTNGLSSISSALSSANRNVSVNNKARGLETVARDVGFSRTGVKTSVVSKTDTQIVSDKILSTSIIPYVRSRPVLVQVRGLKPNTKFYAFFDDINVTTYCSLASYLKYTPTGANSVFDSTTNAGANAKEAGRQVNYNSEVAYNIGDVVSNFNNTATAVVVGSHKDSTGSYLHVVNIKGRFAPNQIINGSISRATAKTVAVDSTQTTCIINNSSLVSTSSGDLNLVFSIPNSNNTRFKTGIKEFKLIDNATDTQNYSSKATAQYVAQGVLETKQATVNAVRNANIVRENVTETNTIVETVTRPIGSTCWYDPLAQSFLVQNKGGAFLTKVDLFFATKDETLPVTIEIREMVNGYPGKRVLPFSRVTLTPEKINVSSKYVKVDSILTPRYDTATTFAFPSPVYVNDNQEYCLVIMSDSNKYKVWISQVGDSIPDSQRTISEQPYSGVLFKSQNASTWTANQNQDLKFKFYKAKFNINKTGSVNFINSLIPQQRLEKDPFQFKAGSSKVIVYHANHGFKPGDSVKFSGVGSVINGIAASAINTTHIIPSGNIQLDSYMIDLGSTNIATTSGYFGGSDVYATNNYTYNTVHPIVQVQSFPDTLVTYELTTTDYATGYTDLAKTSVIANDNNTFFTGPKVVKAGSTPSVTLTCYMQSTNDSISPVIDTHRTSLVLASNKIDAPTADTTNYAGFDAIYVADTAAVGCSNYSNYVTRKIKFVNPSNLIKIKLSANIPAQSSFDMYYRASPTGSDVDLNAVTWTKLDPEDIVINTEAGTDTFIDISYMASVNSFDALQIKIAMKSTNTSAVPRIKDLRIIACA